ncbi:hypothetical protein OSTOST_19159, partial [Ostertagia ostertagi]
MYSRKRPAINPEVFAKRKLEATDEEDLEGEDEAEGSQCDFRQTAGFTIFTESRKFSTTHEIMFYPG